jgi:predicted dehydrogenase
MKKIAIIGMGKMGSKYAKMVLENQELGYILVASTRINNENGEKIKQYLGTFKVYDNDSDLFLGYDNGEFECDSI